MLAFLAGPIAKAILGIFGDSIVKPFLDAWAKKQDIDLEKFKAQSVKDQVIAASVIEHETARVNAQRDIVLAGMNHPIWWLGWLIFVLPVGFYHAAIFIGSTLNWSHVVLRVPPVQEQWAMWIVMSLFGAQAATGVVTGIANKIGKRA